MKIAIVTGASSGLGKEFVFQLEKMDLDLDEIWILARRMDRLIEIQNTCNLPIKPVCIDLCDSNQMDCLEREINLIKPDIKILINAAGMGKIGNYKTISRKEADWMINLNCKAAIDMTYICLPYMKENSHILQICSTSAFQPLPYLNIYAASKSFLYRFSRALRMECKKDKIHVCAICPYWINDTEFIQNAQSDVNKDIKSYPLASKTDKVVKRALYDAFHNFAVSTPGILCTLHRFFSKLFPSSFLMSFWNLLRKI